MYQLTATSKNAKTGPIAVTRSAETTCPPSCGTREFCFAKYGRLAMHWRRMKESGTPWRELLGQVSKLVPGTLLRWNDAGDLPGEGEAVDTGAMGELAQVLRKARVVTWTFTHKKGREHWALYRDHPMVINLSADSLQEVDSLGESGLPLVVTLPLGAPKVARTPAGMRVVRCPAVGETEQTRHGIKHKATGVTCGAATRGQACGGGNPLCARRDRTYAIGFPVHGARRYLASQLLNEREGGEE